MKNSLLATICWLALAGICNAQDCSNWGNWDVRGTYAMHGSGWIDLSKIVPALPAGTVPMSWVGALSYNGKGGGSGWAAINAGGAPLNVDLVDITYDVKPDCSIAVTYKMNIKGVGTIGPAPRVLVIAGSGSALELFGIEAGEFPGAPLDSIKMRRISMQFK